MKKRGKLKMLDNNLIETGASRLNFFASEIYENAKAHGWWDTERSIAEIVALIHSELSEALEEYRDNAPALYWRSDDGAKIESKGVFEARHKPEGVAVELADVIIRILDYCGRRVIDIEEAVEIRRAGYLSYALPELVAECHYLLSMAYKSEEARSLYLAEIISIIRYWCHENSIDIDATIQIKHSYNKKRSYRHGGKII
jgi:NTP pyrophosphatase (non-canonical NTP hydrolase)